jgi:NAD(P)-dependent dehydrogenase (short-subunit alcohol dehydrogenase family)
MSSRHLNPTVLITGSNRGLGLEWSRQYAGLGWRVHASCRHPDEADALHQLADQYPEVMIHRLDVTRPEAIKAVTRAVSTESVDILINNAGVYFERWGKDPLGHINYADWEATLRVNTLGAARMTEAFADHLARSERRLVVAITSHMGSITDIDLPRDYAYRSSKAALNAAMKGVSLELQPQGIGVLMLHPGWVRTRMGGPDAPLSPEESVRGMRTVIDRFDLSMSGHFYRYDGVEMPW